MSLTPNLGHGAPLFTQWKEESLFFETSSYFEKIKENIQRAKKTIDHEVYIFKLDSFGSAASQLLIDATNRGVKVRVLVDAFGSFGQIPEIERFFKKSKVELRIFNSFWQSNFFKNLSSYNRRNHRKIWIFDGETAFASSANTATTQWKEIGIQVSGFETRFLVFAFEKLWKKKFLPRISLTQLKKLNPLRISPEKLVILNDSIFKRLKNYYTLLTQMKLAKKRILLANAYFSPPYGVIRQLVLAAKRGVEVTILVTHKSDVFFMPWLTQTYYADLIKAGVKIYEYLPQFYHAKVKFIDEEIHVGSSNLNHRSFLHDLEVDVKVTHKKNAALLEAEIQKDLELSKQISLSDLGHVSIFKKFFSYLLLRLRYWL